jgi:aspartate/methionine/tyrosine aminotransferase
MEFPQIEYFEWVKKYFGKVKFNLANSGISAVDKRTISEISRKVQKWPPTPSKFEGDPDLLEQLSKVYRIPADNFLTASGASEANFLVMASLIKPGDRVLVESPTYEPLFRVPALFGARIDFIKREPQLDYDFDMDIVNDMATRNVSMMIISNPHNPSGGTLSTRSLKALCEIAEDRKCYLLSDEVYRDFVFKRPPRQACELSEYGITTNSLTKVFGLASLRTGWIAAAPPIVSQCLKMKFNTSVISSPVTEKLAYHALLKRDKFMQNAQKVIEKNVPLVKKWVKKHNFLHLKFPKNGPFIFPRFLNINVTELTQMLIDYYDTLIAPGKYFGASEYARIAYVCDTDTLKNGLENIEIAVNALT